MRLRHALATGGVVALLAWCWAPPVWALDPPASIAMTVSGTSATVSWPAAPGAANYAIRIHKGGTPYEPCESMIACQQQAGLTYNFTAQYNATYDFWVHAVDGSGNLSATVSGGSFSMPAQSANVTITWAPNTEADMSYYSIRAAVGPTCTRSSPVLTSVPHPTTTWTGSVPATANALYAFCMTAVDRTGNESGISNTITREIIVSLGPVQPTGLTVQVIP